jgi:hypothetical protein
MKGATYNAIARDYANEPTCDPGSQDHNALHYCGEERDLEGGARITRMINDASCCRIRP